MSNQDLPDARIEWVLTPGDLKSPLAPPGIAERLLANDRQIQIETADRQAGDPVLPCRQPWLELTLYLDSGEPAAHADYTFSSGPAGGRSGKLDERGFVHLDGFEYPINHSDLLVSVIYEGGKARYHVEAIPAIDVRAKRHSVSEEEEGDDVIESFRVNFGSLAPVDDEDDGGDD